MNMLGHDDESVQGITTFATVVVEGLKEYSNIFFDNEEFAALPGRES
jgi:hypothetical protein